MRLSDREESTVRTVVDAPVKSETMPRTVAQEWSMAEAMLVLAVAFALLVGVRSIPADVAGSPLMSGLIVLVHDAALGALLFLLLKRHATPAMTALRLDRTPEMMSVLRALGVAVGCWLFSLLYRSAALGFGIRPPAGDGADLRSLFGSGAMGPALTVLAVAIIGPVLEELLLRGIVLRAVAGRTGVWLAIVVSAVAFALLHASAWSFLPLFVLGIGLGWVAVKSRSLWPAIGAHVLYNGIFVAAALYVSSTG